MSSPSPKIVNPETGRVLAPVTDVEEAVLKRREYQRRHYAEKKQEPTAKDEIRSLATKSDIMQATVNTLCERVDRLHAENIELKAEVKAELSILKAFMLRTISS